VILAATPAIGSVFTGWSGGGCAGTATCTLAGNAPVAVTATFNLVTYPLTVATAGPGFRHQQSCRNQLRLRLLRDVPQRRVAHPHRHAEQKHPLHRLTGRRLLGNGPHLHDHHERRHGRLGHVLAQERGHQMMRVTYLVATFVAPRYRMWLPSRRSSTKPNTTVSSAWPEAVGRRGQVLKQGRAQRSP
jgi:Divergent InlB B-repeat domain